MATKNLHYWLMKLARVTGWLLFFLMIIYITTGFALCGKLGVSRVIDLQTALAIHKLFDWPLVVIFSVHSVVTIYFSMRRWGWIRKSRSSRPREANRSTGPVRAESPSADAS